MRLYLDSAPVIYVVENIPLYAPAVEARLAEGGMVLVVSDLTRLECRVKPMRESNTALLKDFDDFFEEVIDQTVILAREVIDHATGIRAEYGFRTPDAIHLAAAVLSHCDVFLTNDHQLSFFKDIAIEVVAP